MSAERGSLEERIAALEAEVAALKAQLESKPKVDWTHAISGTFANDPLYDEAMRLGRKWRESYRGS
jgi:hypothetical protein